MRREALFERVYLLPAPTGNYGSCKRQELKYAVGSAVQTRILSIVKVGDEPLFRHRVVHYWTPHSGRNFLPSATGALGYSKQERDVLGGWSAQGSARYTRLARQRISVMQSAVVNALQDKSSPDPLCEEESHQGLEAFMREAPMPPTEVERTMKLITSRVFSSKVQEELDPHTKGKQCQRRCTEFSVGLSRPLNSEFADIIITLFDLTA